MAEIKLKRKEYTFKRHKKLSNMCVKFFMTVHSKDIKN